MSTNTTKPLKPTLLRGAHPGFGRLKSQPGVFRAKLRPETTKRRPDDYRGTIFLDGDQRPRSCSGTRRRPARTEAGKRPIYENTKNKE
jgi:hypothetical protein